MELLDPIYTEKRECQDCHKCIRQCPVKAIRVEDTYAQVVPGFCIMCGDCVSACPSNAVQVRRDLQKAQALVADGGRVLVSLDPSFVAQYPDVRPAQLIHALKDLGFYAVSETALGAEQVSAKVVELMRQGPRQIWISSTCSSVMDLISMYHPECLPHVTPVLSPMLAHGKMLRAQFGNDISVVFIGPCIAKKREAEEHPGVVDVVLTFEELGQWMSGHGTHLAEIVETEADRFEPEAAHEGALYAVDGGMAPGVTAGHEVEDVQFMSFSGVHNVERALKDIPKWNPDHNMFLELNGCAGSCINGPKAASNSSIARRRYDVVRYAKARGESPHQVAFDIARSYRAAPVNRNKYSEFALRETLRWVGQYSTEDELNCGGCGYESCLDFADALLCGNAERMMCTTYTRKLAQKKANALLQRMPSAVVIVDEDLKIIERNPSFTRLFTPIEGQSQPVEGAALSEVLPFANLFRRVLDSGEDIVGHDIRYRRNILTTSIFTIEPHSVVGGIFRDITEPTSQKEQIVGRAQEVIEKNLKTAQKIAFLLGENAADSEVILNSIVRSFRPEEVDDDEAGSE